MAVNIFLCYAHQDEKLLDALKTHLMPLVRINLIKIWYDRNISAGSEWRHSIEHHLDSSQIILLLISADFIASNYCYNVEMTHALARHNSGTARVIPVILRDVHWRVTPLAELLALPKDALPITDTKWHTKDRAFTNVVEGIRRVIDEHFHSHAYSNPATETADPNISTLKPIVEYERKNTPTSKIHGCTIRFFLSHSHSLQYRFTWEPWHLLSPVSRFMLWLDGSNLIDRSKDDMRYIDEHFLVENEDGMIFCYHEKQKIRVLIKVGDRVLFDNKDVWGSVQ